MRLSGTIRSVSDLLTTLADLGWSGMEHAHIRYWFRGQADQAWALEPGVYRPSFKFALRTDRDEEASRLLTEQHLYQDFRVLSAGLRTGRETDPDLYFLQQHHGMPTRLLDWSNVPLAALFFAVSDGSAITSDALFSMMDVYQVGPSRRAQAGNVFEGIATNKNLVFSNAIDVIAHWHAPGDFPDFIIPVRPDYLDARMTLQRSCFTFHVPQAPAITEELNPTLRSFEVKAVDKLKIQDELALLGVDAFTIYGDLDHLAQRLKMVRPM